jgi:hypothetical protein
MSHLTQQKKIQSSSNIKKREWYLAMLILEMPAYAYEHTSLDTTEVRQMLS